MNDENLIQNQNRSPSELRENSRKGGVASGISRGFKAALKRKIKDNPELTEEIIDVLLSAVFEDRNMKAAKMLLELNDEGISDLDRKLKRAQLDKIKAETELLKKSGDDKIVTENNLVEILKAGGADDLDKTE